MSAARAAPILRLDASSNLEDVLKNLPGTVVLTNGCFDLLHEGHVRFLQGCAALGDR